MSLIKNYFSSLFRFSLKDRFYTLLNLFGLAIGMASAIMIFLYIQDELSFDKHNTDYERIYRLEGDFYINGKQDLTAITQIPLAPTLKDEYPEIEEMTRILPNPGIYFRSGEDIFKEDSIALADSTIFNVFTIEMIRGDQRTALVEPLTMVISESMADKYFGSPDIINESLRNLDGSEYRITGVFKDLPRNTHLRFNGLMSAKTIEEQIGTERFNDRSANSFWNVAGYSYVKLAENTTAQMVLDKFPEFYDKYMKELGDRLEATFDLRMTNVADQHYLPEELSWDLPKGNMNYIYILAIIAIFLVFIAGVNYTNLTTARAAQRGKEIGIRKVGGASRGILRKQFLSESLITALMAGIVALLLIMILLPVFNGFSEKAFRLGDIFQWDILLFIVGLTLLTGILSGLYPAYYLSSFDPVAIMKGGSDGLREKGWLRRVLVVAQFVVSAAMIIGTIVVALQLTYMRNKPLGFDRDQIITLQLNDTSIVNNVEAFKEELKRNPVIEGAARSTSVPGRFFGKSVMTVESGEGEMQEKTVNSVFVDYDFIDVYGMKLKDQPNARKFSKEFGSDLQSSFIINEAVAREFNHGEESVGKRFRPGVSIDGQGPPEGQIIGVLEDFHFASLHNPVDGLMLRVNEGAFLQTLSVRFAEGQAAEALDWIKETREKFNPTYPIQYAFLQDEIEELYTQERIVFSLFIAFTVLVLFISAIGLLGLSSFMTAKRTRETGIRRVMGATQNQIILLFITQFSKWVIISNIVAWPLSWLVMSRWLENFEFRKDFPFWSFGVSLMASLVIAILTVSWQSIKAARMDPARSLKAD
ncbi:MAG: ABC transporter permease [Bacteroidales bacterium]|nr:ABC transporter permease [Bacteroidales bacterium]MDT8430360.1 FtsX-like permease family protein [Bacteroidales bacterium]